MKHLFLSVIIMMSVAMISCEKEDHIYNFPPETPADTTQHPLLYGVADIGMNYDNQVYFNLSTGGTVSKPFRNYDLAFEAAPSGFHIYMNTGKLMFACRTGSVNMTSADTTGKQWFTDNDHLDADSTAINNSFHSASVAEQVYVIDRGKPEYNINWPERLRKLMIAEVTDSSYTIIYSKYNNTSADTFIISKNTNYSLMYFTFDNGGQLVQMAPEKSQWDFVFTRYTHTYFSEPLNSPYRYYLVNGGGLNNRWHGVTGIMLKDSLPRYVPFDDFKLSNVGNYTFLQNADIIGFDWKSYDFNSSTYLIVPNKYFVIRNVDGNYFKIRFTDFYNPQTGDKGYISFQYQQL